MIIYEEILSEFRKQKVKYVIVGGIAVNLLGSLRSTADMDILVEMSDSNLAKVVRVLTRQGYRVKQPVDPMGLAEEATRKDWTRNKRMKAFDFYKEGGFREVDIIIETPVTFEQARKTALRIRCGDIVLPVISIDNLIKMKKKSFRNIDKVDIEELRKIKRLRKKIK
jgi:hypothetical protein